MKSFARINLSSVLSSVALAKAGVVAGGPDGTFVNRIADVIVYLLFDQDNGWKTFTPENNVDEKCTEAGPAAYLITKETIHTGADNAK